MFKYSHRNGILADDIGAQLRQDYPLQTLMDPPRTMTGVLNSMDGPRAMRPLPPTKGEMTAAIEAAYAKDSQSIHLQDERGYTPIYVAVIKGHAAVVDKLLSLGDCRADILSRDNIDDQNAIEAQEEIVRSGSPLFKHRALHLLWVLRRAVGEDVGTVHDFSEKRRYGCSCGQCRGGWLSPRMAYLLHGMSLCSRRCFEGLTPTQGKRNVHSTTRCSRRTPFLSRERPTLLFWTASTASHLTSAPG